MKNIRARKGVLTNFIFGIEEAVERKKKVADINENPPQQMHLIVDVLELQYLTRRNEAIDNAYKNRPRRERIAFDSGKAVGRLCVASKFL